MVGQVDWSEAMKAVGGDAALLNTLVETALDEFPRLLIDIGKAVAEGSDDELRFAAHALKGCVRIFGDTEVFRQAYRLEMMGKSGQRQEAAEAFLALEAAFGRFQPILEDHLRSARDAAS